MQTPENGRRRSSTGILRGQMSALAPRRRSSSLSGGPGKPQRRSRPTWNVSACRTCACARTAARCIPCSAILVYRSGWPSGTRKDCVGHAFTCVPQQCRTLLGTMKRSGGCHPLNWCATIDSEPTESSTYLCLSWCRAAAGLDRDEHRSGRRQSGGIESTCYPTNARRAEHEFKNNFCWRNPGE